MADYEETVGQVKTGVVPANDSSFLSQQSTGPRTPEGKDKSKYNAVKHGIFSKVILLKGEPRIVFDALVDGLFNDLHPKGTLEEILVEKLAILLWRYRRLIVAEAKTERLSPKKRKANSSALWTRTKCIRKESIYSDTRPASSGRSIGQWDSLSDFSGCGWANRFYHQSSWKFLPHRDAILRMDFNEHRKLQRTDPSRRLVEPGVQEQSS